jgi:hypothetical protein
MTVTPVRKAANGAHKRAPQTLQSLTVNNDNNNNNNNITVLDDAAGEGGLEEACYED